MKLVKLYAEAFLEATTDNYKGNGHLAPYRLKNGITLQAVKDVMQDIGYYTDTMTDKQLLDDIQEDWENKFLRKREYWNSYARATKQTQHFTASVKGCKEIYKYLTSQKN